MRQFARSLRRVHNRDLRCAGQPGAEDMVGICPQAMVPDSAEFSGCAADTTRVDRIDRGRALGALLKVRGTPTVIVNGWRFPIPPSDSQMRRIVTNILQGKKPHG
jgi:hypothetical protein